jgi:hypothetical protein
MLSNNHRSAGLSAAKETGRTCIITMVHGTWGRGFFPKEYRAGPPSWLGKLVPAARPPWFHEESVFRRRLESALQKENIPATFRIFRWSGANSVFHRARAADELNRLLASDPDNVNSIVIAHSHGGNVAFRAISQLGSRGGKIHLVTLATPFLRVFPTWSGPGFWQVASYFFVAIALGIPLSLVRLINLMPQGGLHGMPQGAPSDDWGVTVFMLIDAILAALISIPLVRLIINPSPPPAKRQLDRQTKIWAWRPFDIAEAANYDSVGPQAPDLLVIRGVDDEAALALAFGSIANAINRFALKVMWKWLYPLMSVIVSFFVLLGYLLRSGSGIDFALVLKIGGLSWVVLMASTFVLLLIPGLFNSWFAREFLIGALRCEIAADSAPDSTRARIVTLATPYQPLPIRGLFGLRSPRAESTSTISSMRHKIYNYPGCAPEIVKWVNEHFESHA